MIDHALRPLRMSYPPPRTPGRARPQTVICARKGNPSHPPPPQFDNEPRKNAFRGRVTMLSIDEMTSTFSVCYILPSIVLPCPLFSLRSKERCLRVCLAEFFLYRRSYGPVRLRGNERRERNSRERGREAADEQFKILMEIYNG